MKKLLLGALLLLSTTVFAQDTFVKKYTSFIIKENDVLKPWVSAETTVVFNPNHVRDVIFYYSDSTSRTFHQITEVTTGTTESGEAYQVVHCIGEDGIEMTLQLFDDDSTLRIIVSAGNSIEFHRD
jgi:hypothetical protein